MNAQAGITDLTCLEAPAERGVVNLREFLEVSADWAAYRFKQVGRITPMWHADTGSHWLLIASNLRDKDASVAAVRQFFAMKNVRRYVFMAEAWILESGVGGQPKISEAEMRAAAARGLADNPDAREVVALTAEDISGMLMARLYIERPARGKAKLGALQIDEGGRMEGLMVGLLPHLRKRLDS